MKGKPTALPPSKAVHFKQPSGADKLVRFISQLVILAVWKSLTAVGAPLGRFFAIYFWCGKNFTKLTAELQRIALRTLGWLNAPAVPRDHWLRYIIRQYSPIDLKRWHVGLAALILVSVLGRLVRKLRERFDERLRQLQLLRKRMQNASSYAEWKELAKQIDQLEGIDARELQQRWKEETKLYDRKLLQEKLTHLRKVRSTRNIREMMFALRTDLIRNVGNITNSRLHEHSYVVPEPIVTYIEEVKEQLNQLCDSRDDELSVDEKLSFFRETRHAFGRTALLLSGGGGLGTFHIGVVKALFEHRLLPRVIGGSSVGSIVSAIVATRTDDELRNIFNHLDEFDVGFFHNNRAVEFVQHFLAKGHLQDINYLVKKMRALIGDLTFLEAYERTGRILSITVCPADTLEPPRLLNYLTAPQCLVWSAVACSSAFPGLFPPQNLIAKNSAGGFVRFSAQATNDSLERRWRDGSLENDLPMESLKEMFNCNYFLVSQTNPHIVPLLGFKRMMWPKLGNLWETELKHRCMQLQSIFPDSFKWLTLFTQTWEGDATMVYPITLGDLAKAIVNPTTEELMKAVKSGETATWAKLSAIECNCAIEATLDSCLARVTNSMRGKPMRTMGNRIPSWLHMPTLGMPSVASWGSMQEAGDAHASWGQVPVGKEAVMEYPMTPVVEEGQTPNLSPAESVDGTANGSFSRAGSNATYAQMDCLDNSSNIWKDLFMPLAAAASYQEGNGLDFIAP